MERTALRAEAGLQARGGVLRFAAHILAHDWSSTPLGPIDAWPRCLQMLVAQSCASALPMAIRWGPRDTQIFNAAAAERLGPTVSALQGTSLADTHPAIWEELAAAHDAALRGETAVLKRRGLSFPKDEADRWVSVDLYFAPAFDGDGEIQGSVCTAAESTEAVRQEIAARAAGAEAERLRALLKHAPGVIGLLKGPDHVFEAANLNLLAMVGRPLVGLPMRDALPETVSQGYVALLDQAYFSGETVIGRRRPVELADGEGALQPYYFDFVYQPTRGPDGAVTGVFMLGTDITEHADALERQKLLADELNHRVKNTLAVVLSIARLSARSAADARSFTRGFIQRVEAMAGAHDLLTQAGWTPVELIDLLQLECAPYAAAAERMALTCERITIPAQDAVKVSLVVHELFANAAKHGVLSGKDGRLEIECRLTDGRIALEWRESGGRPAVLDAQGFGTLLINRLVRDFGGQVTRKATETGILIRISLPDPAANRTISSDPLPA